jgi:hypothetical protein
MKKLSFAIVVTLFACIFNSCVSLGSLDYPEPELDKPLAYVIDTFKAKGSFEDYVKLHNNSTDSNINFNIYIHHPGTQEWMVYGSGVLKSAGDTDTIDTNIKDIDKYRYFAIQSLNSKNYKYQFNKSGNDLHITVLDN